MSRAAFTLLELVFVLAIALVLFYFTAAALSKLMESSAITTGAQMVSDCLAEGRQDAIAQNTPVEVRFYATSAAGYGALQLHWRQADGTTPAAALPVILPGTALIDATPVHSTLVTINQTSPAVDPTDPRLNALTRCFHFLPNGSTDLASGTQWTLTVRAATSSNPAQFPSNWACITVDPFTGRPQVFRP